MCKTRIKQNSINISWEHERLKTAQRTPRKQNQWKFDAKSASPKLELIYWLFGGESRLSLEGLRMKNSNHLILLDYRWEAAGITFKTDNGKEDKVLRLIGNGPNLLRGCFLETIKLNGFRNSGKKCQVSRRVAMFFWKIFNFLLWTIFYALPGK